MCLYCMCVLGCVFNCESKQQKKKKFLPSEASNKYPALNFKHLAINLRGMLNKKASCSEKASCLALTHQGNVISNGF